MIGVFLGTLAALATVGAVALSAGGDVRPGIKVYGFRESCCYSILFVAPSGLEGRAIDRITGSLGYSHVVFDSCEHDALGNPVVIDCTPGQGVHRRPLSDYDGRPRSAAVLTRAEGAEVFGCLRGRIGMSYDLLGLVKTSGPAAGMTCSQLLAECLPARLRAMVRYSQSRPVAPNDLARAFGLTGPAGPDVEI